MLNRIAVIADIHSNYIALKTCIDHALQNKVDRFIFLGDYLGDCACPQKTLQFLYQLAKDFNCSFIRGNKENYWINQIPLKL